MYLSFFKISFLFFACLFALLGTKALFKRQITYTREEESSWEESDPVKRKEQPKTFFFIVSILYLFSAISVIGFFLLN